MKDGSRGPRLIPRRLMSLAFTSRATNSRAAVASQLTEQAPPSWSAAVSELELSSLTWTLLNT